MANLKSYKAAVRSFLKQVLNTYEVSERRFIDRVGRRRLFIIVDRIDEQLEQLTQMVIDKQDTTLVWRPNWMRSMVSLLDIIL